MLSTLQEIEKRIGKQKKPTGKKSQKKKKAKELKTIKK